LFFSFYFSLILSHFFFLTVILSVPLFTYPFLHTLTHPSHHHSYHHHTHTLLTSTHTLLTSTHTPFSPPLTHSPLHHSHTLLTTTTTTTGPYPATFKASQHPSEEKDKIPKTGEIHWSNQAWTAILKHAKFLHINVAGKDSEDLDKIKKIVTDLDLTHANKIIFNFNKTLDRGSYNNKKPEEKKG
jgi:hypothetical protein